MKNKANRSFLTNIKDGYKAFDLFGESIGFTVKGSSTHRGYFGALVSMIIIFIVASYAIEKYFIMIYYDDTSF